MANTYLEDIDFSAPASDVSCGAHIAYTFAEQGGAASGFNNPLMFKNNAANAELSFEKLETLKALGEDVTELRKSYVSQIMDSLQSAVNDKYSDGWSWVSVVDADFDNSLVIFVTDFGLYAAGFTINGLTVELEDTATPVMPVTDYQVLDGAVLISIDYFDDMIDEALANLVKSTIKHSHVKELLVKAKAKPEDNSVNAEETHAGSTANTPEIQKGELPLELNKEEFLKSAEFQDLMKAQIAEAVEKASAEAKEAAQAEAQEAIAKAQAELEELRKAEQARIEEDYATVLKSYGFVSEEKVDVLVKYLVANSEVADAIVESFDKAKDEVATVKAEFAAEKGASVENASAVVKSSSDLIAKRAQEMKARKSK